MEQTTFQKKTSSLEELKPKRELLLDEELEEQSEADNNEKK